MISFEQAEQYIHDLDFSYIVNVMCAENYPLPRWTVKDAEQCATLYKNFLILHKKYLPISLVPTREIDEFWHNHILHTQKYFYDCQQIFGHYLHHRPASLNDNLNKLVDDFLKTKELYLREFGEPLVLVSQ